MTISRLLILQAMLACGLGTVFLVPRQAVIQPCRVRMQLPDILGGMTGTPGVITEKEHEILAGDTQFCREVYDDGFGEQVEVSIVLSGEELDSSIHRPERCLPTQGWNILSTGHLTLPVPEAPGGQLPLTRLLIAKTAPRNGGGTITVRNLNYYWFVGYSDITASHFHREFIDMKDRLLHGYDQKWAYVTVTANITDNLERFGKDEGQTDLMLQKVIAQVYPLIVKPMSEVASAQP